MSGCKWVKRLHALDFYSAGKKLDKYEYLFLELLIVKLKMAHENVACIKLVKHYRPLFSKETTS